MIISILFVCEISPKNAKNQYKKNIFFHRIPILSENKNKFIHQISKKKNYYLGCSRIKQCRNPYKIMICKTLRISMNYVHNTFQEQVQHLKVQCFIFSFFGFQQNIVTQVFSIRKLVFYFLFNLYLLILNLNHHNYLFKHTSYFRI